MLEGSIEVVGVTQSRGAIYELPPPSSPPPTVRVRARNLYQHGAQKQIRALIVSPWYATWGPPGMRPAARRAGWSDRSRSCAPKAGGSRDRDRTHQGDPASASRGARPGGRNARSTDRQAINREEASAMSCTRCSRRAEVVPGREGTFLFASKDRPVRLRNDVGYEATT